MAVVVVVVVSTTYKPACAMAAYAVYAVMHGIYADASWIIVPPYVRVAIYVTYGHAQPCWLGVPASSLSCFSCQQQTSLHRARLQLSPPSRGAALLLCVSFCSVYYRVHPCIPPFKYASALYTTTSGVHTSIIPSSSCCYLHAKDKAAHGKKRISFQSGR